MIVSIYCIFDTVAVNHGQPFVAVNNAVAERMVMQAMGDAMSKLRASPQDFELVCIGTFDDSSGRIVPLDSPELLCSLQDLRSIQVADGVREDLNKQRVAEAVALSDSKSEL